MGQGRKLRYQAANPARDVAIGLENLGRNRWEVGGDMDTGTLAANATQASFPGNLFAGDHGYRRIFESMRDAFILWKLDDGLFVEWNTAFVDLVRYSPEELGRLSCAELTPPQWQAVECGIIEAAGASRRPVLPL
jgi:PAS domain-containing protein